MLVQTVSHHTGRPVCFRAPSWQLHWWSRLWFASIPSHSLPSRIQAGIQWTLAELRAWCGERVRHPLLKLVWWFTYYIKRHIMHLSMLESNLRLTCSLFFLLLMCVSVCFRWRQSVRVPLYLSQFFNFLLHRQVIKQIKPLRIISYFDTDLKETIFCMFEWWAY